MRPESSTSAAGRRRLLPPAVRLPAAAGVIVFAVAVGTTQVALQVTNREADRQLERLAQVYLDGLAASVQQGVSTRDGAYVAQRFARAFGEQRGVAERALFAFDGDGALIARHGDDAIETAQAAAASPGPMRMDALGSTAWVARAVENERGSEPAGRIVAALDVGPMLAARQRLSWGIMALDLVLAALFAGATWAVLARLGRPLRSLVEALSDGASRPPENVPDRLLATADARTARVLQAYNRMVDGVRERERLAAELAEREQAAALGRMAATVAHEVRNPLAGLATAVSTLRRFGEDAEVRAESLAFLERGIGALDRIVTSTLNIYRPEEERRLTAADFDDLRQLLRPAAEQRGVTIAFSLDLPEDEVTLGSGGVRQVLLNLLLNACNATAPGGAVELRAWIEGGELVCEVADQGPGLDPSGAERLMVGDRTAAPRSRRLGLDVVVGLLGSLDARASVSAPSGGGTLIRLAIPLGAGQERPA